MKPNKLILFLTLFLLSVTLKADEFDDYIAKIDAYRDNLSSNYKNVITNQHKYNINKYFALTSVDHKTLAMGLHLLARENLETISGIARKFDVLKAELNKYPERVNELSVQFFILLSEAKRQRIHVQDYHSDLLILQESWNSHCDDARLKQLDRYFKPLANFSPNQDVGFLSAPKSPNGFTVNTSISSNGDMNAYYSGKRPGGSEKEEEGWQIAAGGVAVAAGVICGVFTLGLGSQACATWGYFIVMAIKIITDVVRFSDDLKKMSENINKQAEIRQSIYDLQLNAIKELERETDSYLKTSCEQRFIKNQKWPIEKVNQLTIKTEETYSKINEFVVTELADIKESHYDYLINNYFPTLVDTYLFSIKEYYQNRTLLNEKSRTYVAERMVPSLKELKNSQTRTAKVHWQQQIWTDVIKGDAIFLKDESFSFFDLKNEDGQVSFTNEWRSFGPEILKRAAQ